MKNNLIAFTMILAMVIIGCNGKVSHKKLQAKTYVVKKESLSKRLFFTGTIQPLQESTITSPMDAVVESIHFHYGQSVKKGDVIFTLNSNDLQKQYNDTLTEYLKAKDSFSLAKAKFRGTQDLWDAGLLSKNNYVSEKSNLATARVSLMQAAGKLTDMLEKMDDGSSQHLSSLSIAEFDKVRKALAGRHNLIQMKAPIDGVLLYPPKTGDEKTSKLTVGSTIKASQVLGLVGDLSGVSIEIEVPEIDIDKIHPGQEARITGVALNNETLQGKLVVVNSQASNTQGSALPSFSAVIEVNDLTAKQREAIRVGMSASIEIVTEASENLLIPISAIQQKQGQALVKVQKEGKLEPVLVKTGSALADKVVVVSGLKVGDVVAYD